MIDVRHPLNVCRASAGTGKTYTLAAYYVGLLLSGEDYRSILAITFTNKATAEMSERIIGYLYAISQGEERAFLSYARTFMLRHAHASDEQLAQRAHECFRAMLLDYDNMQVMTIDSFLQTLLSGLAGVLRMSAGLNTELDIDHVIRQAVDQFITTEMTPEARAIIEEYLRVSLDDEHRWDIRESLFIMAKELYNESVQMKQLEGRVLFTAESIRQRRERLLAAWETN
ncbi:MAG: UvrD-helicase domain-containing protein, partial [Paludibacteraceae bacterium]|nr:UvrD-helicase domain-containing protein [Paludibacteraceae bacterium]